MIEKLSKIIKEYITNKETILEKVNIYITKRSYADITKDAWIQVVIEYPNSKTISKRTVYDISSKYIYSNIGEVREEINSLQYYNFLSIVEKFFAFEREEGEKFLEEILEVVHK